jgi:hypothetical protein
MAWKAFAFALGQRVNVPGKKGVQGVVSTPRTTDVMEAPDVSGDSDLYLLRWLNESGRPVCGWFGEPDLTAAQPVPVTATEIGSELEALAERVLAPRRKPARRRKTKR